MIRFGLVAPDDIRFFVGYAGWGPNQLKDEMQMKSWILNRDSDKFTFTESGESLWSEILKTMGGKYKVMANFPVDPSLN